MEIQVQQLKRQAAKQKSSSTVASCHEKAKVTPAKTRHTPKEITATGYVFQRFFIQPPLYKAKQKSNIIYTSIRIGRIMGLRFVRSYMRWDTSSRSLSLMELQSCTL